MPQQAGDVRGRTAILPAPVALLIALAGAENLHLNWDEEELDDQEACWGGDQAAGIVAPVLVHDSDGDPPGAAAATTTTMARTH